MTASTALPITSLLHTQQPTIELNFMDCQIQSGGCDCRPFTVTNATAIVLGDNPNKLFAKMRRHLLPVSGKLMLATFPHEEKQMGSEESGDCGLFQRLLHLQNG